jgi:hypothetical protein
MGALNNLYNFKNPIRHFFNIDSVKSRRLDEMSISDVSWTEPIKLKIKKGNNLYRVLKLPNIINFKLALNKIKTSPCFLEPHKLDVKKRSRPNYKTGDFISRSYSISLEKDFSNLCIYDCLLRIDIKEFYNRLYTHDIDIPIEDNYITNMNRGRTNGLLMGNYISLYLAELFLVKISSEIQEEININGIDCKFNYFSDDFYFYCNQDKIDIIKKVFQKILNKYSLEVNSEKIEIWDYEKYTNYNVVEQYWKKIVADTNLKNSMIDSRNSEREEDEPLEMKKYWFTNQLLYRSSKLSDEKLRYVLCVNFFKSNFFNSINPHEYELQTYSIHQILSLYKKYPEIMLYSIEKFCSYESFKLSIVDFLKVRYRESLIKEYHEEQLYYFYAIKWLNLESLLTTEENINLVVKSDNQILISYYAMYRYFKTETVNELLNKTQEEYWFQNYHLILFYKFESYNSFIDILVPQYCKKDEQKKTYDDFYSLNFSNKVSFLKDIKMVNEEIKGYIKLKNEERNVS